MLHTVNKSPFQTSTLKSCLAHTRKGDAVLLMEDGVFAALKGSAVAGEIAAKSGDVQIVVLEPDVAARGLGKDRLIDGVSFVDYAGFVELVEKHETSQAWL